MSSNAQFARQAHRRQPPKDLRACSALIIDTNQASRSLMRAMLSDLGLQNIAQAARIGDARRAMETRSFDLVLCDFHFDDCDFTGADLLDELRRSNLLPYSTIFIMVTAEASYEKVAEAAESALDSYLLKPHTVNNLALRVELARQRKIVLADIFEAIEQEAFEQACDLCLARFDSRGEYWLYAARIGGELMLRLQRHDDAKRLFEAISAAKAVPWARLGVARAQLDAGQLQPAKRTLESLIAEQPSFVDAYDVMARAQLQSGNFEQARQTYAQAAALTPASIARQQKMGMLAFYMADEEAATKALEKACKLGLSSRLFDFQSLVMLALMRFEKKDHTGVMRCHAHLARALHRQPDSARIRRMLEVVEIAADMLHRRATQAGERLAGAFAEAGELSFDFEAAGNLLNLLLRVGRQGLELPDASAWVERLAERFCVSKASSDMLCLTLEQNTRYAEVVRAAYQRIGESAERALTHAKAGRPDAAVHALIEHGERTRNAKLLDLADMVLQRYASHIEASSALQASVANLRQRYCRFGAHVQLGAEGQRAEGGLSLRAPVKALGDGAQAPRHAPLSASAA